jgi:hypothetical protein
MQAEVPIGFKGLEFGLSQSGVRLESAPFYGDAAEYNCSGTDCLQKFVSLCDPEAIRFSGHTLSSGKNLRQKDALNHAVNKRCQLRLGQCANFGTSHRAVFEDDQRGYTADAKFGCCLGIRIHIQLADLQASGVIICQFIQHRRDHFAGATPFSPEVDHNRRVGLDDVLFKASISDVHYLVAHSNIP